MNCGFWGELWYLGQHCASTDLNHPMGLVGCFFLADRAGGPPGIDWDWDGDQAACLSVRCGQPGHLHLNLVPVP